MPRATATPSTSRSRALRLRWATFTACAATAAAPLVILPLTAEAAPRPVVRWSDTNVEAGRKVVATVKPGSLPKGASPVLQRRFPDAWRVADGKAERTDSGLKLRVPSDQYGEFSYRVVARDGRRTVSASESTNVRVRPTYDPRGRKRSYEFLYDQRTRWESCRPIRWKFNDSRAPRRGLEQVKAGVRRVHAATGLEFDYVGKSDRKANPYGDNISGATLVIGWRSARTFRRYVNSSQVVGLAGQRFASGYRDAQGPVYRTLQGGVILNAAHRLGGGFGKGTTWGEVIVHELGHIVGLDHASSQKQVMYYSTTDFNANLGKGDLRGMRQLGDTRGCLERTVGRVIQGSGLSR